MPNRTPKTITPHLEPIGMQWLITMKKGDQQLNVILRRKWIVYLSSWWSRSTESFPSNGFLGCPLSCLALWRLIRYDCGGSMSFHQLLQCRRSWSYSWNKAWWMIIYGMPFSIQACGIKFGVLKRFVRIVGRGIHRIIFLKRNGKLPHCRKQTIHLDLCI